MRYRVWEHLAAELLVAESRELVTLNCQNNSLSRAIVTVFAEQVSPTGETRLFETNIAKSGAIFSEFLQAISLSTLFVCDSSTALHNFARRISRYWQGHLELIPTIRVELNILKDSELASELCGWQERDMQHGYSTGVEEHIKDWMDAVQQLPVPVKVDLVMHYPWRDYRGLRGVTQEVRRSTPLPRNVRVRVNRAAWDGIPKPDFHIALTIASIKGAEWPISREFQNNMLGFCAAMDAGVFGDKWSDVGAGRCKNHGHQKEAEAGIRTQGENEKENLS